MDATNAASLPEQPDRNTVESAKSMDSKTLNNDILSTPSHSRSSSTGSNVSSPFASTFSTRSHSRWPSSASSLATNPDSPPLVAKSALHDLLEEPAERDDDQFDFAAEVDALDEFCLCDSIFCEHRRIKSSPGTPLESPLASIDHLLGLDEHAFDSASERRNSDGSSRGRNSRQFHHRLPSISRGWRRRKTTSSTSASASTSGVRSAPLSRSSSFRNLNWKYAITSHLQSPRSDAARESSGSATGSVFDIRYEPDILDDPFFLDLAKESMDQPRAPTPLLPFISSSRQPDGYTETETTLPSPPPPRTHSTTDSPFNSPLSCPTSPTLFRSPTLSTKPSTTSIRTGISLHGADIPLSTTTCDSQFDSWALRLGHANFHILPEPYLPALPTTTETCIRHREDWEAARIAFMRQAALIAEHYGLASRTYTLTCEKWEEVDSQWRRNFEKACAEARTSTLEDNTPAVGMQSPDLRPLPSTQVFLHMPLLSGDKFPAIDAADIVGPMVRYDSIEPPPSHQHGQDAGGGGRKGALLKLITDTASLLRKS